MILIYLVPEPNIPKGLPIRGPRPAKPTDPTQLSSRDVPVVVPEKIDLTSDMDSEDERAIVMLTLLPARRLQVCYEFFVVYQWLRLSIINNIKACSRPSRTYTSLSSSGKFFHVYLYIFKNSPLRHVFQIIPSYSQIEPPFKLPIPRRNKYPVVHHAGPSRSAMVSLSNPNIESSSTVRSNLILYSQQGNSQDNPIILDWFDPVHETL